MQTLEEQLDPDVFFRIHRSAIVRLDRIDTLLRHPGGDYGVRLKNGTELSLSRGRAGRAGAEAGDYAVMLWLAGSGTASCQSTDKSVCATLALACGRIREYGRIHVAQTLLSVLVRLRDRFPYNL